MRYKHGQVARGNLERHPWAENCGLGNGSKAACISVDKIKNDLRCARIARVNEMIARLVAQQND
jgi:hypothetical protein